MTIYNFLQRSLGFSKFSADIPSILADYGYKFVKGLVDGAAKIGEVIQEGLNMYYEFYTGLIETIFGLEFIRNI